MDAYREGIILARGEGLLSEFLRRLALTDLFFLLVLILKRADADNDWVYRQCRLVQASPDGHLDLWSREHYKSTIITFAKTIQDILADPELTVCIFSHTKPIARSFMRQIKVEFETNETLKELFPDILWQQPQKEAPKWNEEHGIIVKRRGNPKEPTLEASGLVDGQPTSRHYKLRIYDDVVTRESISSPDQIKKTTDAWALSLNLGSIGDRSRYIGTRYHYADTYAEMIRRGSADPRVFTPTLDGSLEGEPVLWTREILADKYRDMGPYVSACQLFQNPKLDDAQGFREEWLQYWPAKSFANMNLYLLCDPAGSKKQGSDYTVFMVVGLGPDRNYYVITMVRDRLNLTEKARVLFALHQEYRPRAVGYEKYGHQTDIEHFQEEMERNNYRFGIRPLGGSIAKSDRIRALVPLFEAGRLFLPSSCPRADYTHQLEDLTKAFVEDEYRAFPYGAHDDMLDCLARIVDPGMGATFPNAVSPYEVFGVKGPEAGYDPLRYGLT